mmetsp:Transcript_12097/g.31560  ORF Transcript_12097/g.31560 Transcript_12097/m.31560 type:complete len:115 (+) Transcript_12097:112-456(+)
MAHTPTALRRQADLGNHANVGMRELSRQADLGNLEALFDLAGLYHKGDQDWGVPQDDAEATRLLHLAAEQGYVKEQYALGVCCRDGNGEPQDDVEAVRLFRRAAKKGHAGAQSA